MTKAPETKASETKAPETRAPGRLKLRAKDEHDVIVLSSLLQDALVPRGEITYLGSERRFILLANRFRWEAEPEAASPALEEGADASFEQAAADVAIDEEGKAGKVYSRVISGLCFDRVRAVRSRGLDKAAADGKPLDLLSIRRGLAAWLLSFANGAEIRLEGPAIVAHLEDLGEAWPTVWQPSHKDPEEE